MTKALVLGAEGMLGQMVMRVLSRTQGVSVRGTTRRGTPELLRFEVETGIDALRRIVAEEGPFDLVVNAIGVRSERIDPCVGRSVCQAIQANALFPHGLAAWAEDGGPRVIHVSTDGVFAPEAGPCFEDTPCAPSDIYGQTKALGEPRAARLLTVRCSLVGPNPLGRHGLLEWVRAQPPHGEVAGYTDQAWNGATTLQFAVLCQAMIRNEIFTAAREESPIHHFCPNQTVSKHELVRLLADVFRPDVSVRPSTGPRAVTRSLVSRLHSLTDISGRDRPMRQAIEELAALTG